MDSDLTEYVIYGVIILLIIVLIWMYVQRNDLQSLYDQSLNVQSQLNSQVSGDASQIINLKAQIEKLNAKIVELQPKADELAQYKSIISSNLYTSLKASNAIFGTTTNPQLLQNISMLAADISTKSGYALCDISQILAKSLLKSFDSDSTQFNKELCDPAGKSRTIANLSNNGEFSNSSFIILISATFDLFQAYYCADRTRANFIKIISALVNVICNPSSESKQLYSALYKQLLIDLDNGYKNGSQQLNDKPGIYTPGESYTRPGYTINGVTYPEQYHTSLGYYTPKKIGDSLIDSITQHMKFFS